MHSVFGANLSSNFSEVAPRPKIAPEHSKWLRGLFDGRFAGTPPWRAVLKSHALAARVYWVAVKELKLSYHNGYI